MSAARAKKTQEVALGTRKVIVSNPDRVLFPEDGITKGDLVHYYGDVAHWLLPYVVDRPLTLQRWPEGIHGFSFFEKQVPRGAPEWLATTKQPSSGKRAVVEYPLANDAPSLVWMANLAAITLHAWMSRVESPGTPDFLLFDLDPFEGCTIKTLARVALTVRRELDDVGLVPLVKTTGGKGLHVIVPLAPRYTYDQARAFNEVFARRMKALLPDAIELERSKAKRARGTVYFDWGQLGHGKTIVPAFVVRARPGAPVSTPLAWDEVEALCARRTTRPTHDVFREWNLTTVRTRLAERGDPWKKAFTRGQRLEPAVARARQRWELA